MHNMRGVPKKANDVNGIYAKLFPFPVISLQYYTGYVFGI